MRTIVFRSLILWLNIKNILFDSCYVEDLKYLIKQYCPPNAQSFYFYYIKFVKNILQILANYCDIFYFFFAQNVKRI